MKIDNKLSKDQCIQILKFLVSHKKLAQITDTSQRLILKNLGSAQTTGSAAQTDEPIMRMYQKISEYTDLFFEAVDKQQTVEMQKQLQNILNSLTALQVQENPQKANNVPEQRGSEAKEVQQRNPQAILKSQKIKISKFLKASIQNYKSMKSRNNPNNYEVDTNNYDVNIILEIKCEQNLGSQ